MDHSKEAAELLKKIPAGCEYDDWFHVASALKYEGCSYEVFRDWSAQSFSKFDE